MLQTEMWRARSISGVGEKSLLGGGEDYGAADIIGNILSVARLSLEVYKAIDSASLQREALKLKRLGIEAERQVAFETLAVYKAQEEAARASMSGGISDYILPIAIGAGVILALGYMMTRRR